MADWHGTERMWVIHPWPWYWLVWPWWGGRMYRIVIGVTADVGVPSIYLVVSVWSSHTGSLLNSKATLVTKWTMNCGAKRTKYQQEIVAICALVIFVGVHSQISLTLKWFKQCTWLFRYQFCQILWYMMTSSNGDILSVTGHLCGGIHRSPVNSPLKNYWRGALMFSLICAWINGWVYNREAGDLRRHRAHYDVTVMRQ